MKHIIHDMLTKTCIGIRFFLGFLTYRKNKRNFNTFQSAQCFDYWFEIAQSHIRRLWLPYMLLLHQCIAGIVDKDQGIPTR